MKKSLDKTIDDLISELELPDEYLIRRETALERRKLNGWDIKNSARYDDPSYAPRVAKKISETYSTPEGKEKQRAKSKPHTQQACEKIRQANLGLKKSSEVRTKLSNSKKGNGNRCKIIVTPLGTFPSRKLAVEAYITSGKKNALKWIEKWLLEDPDNFYYVDDQGNRLPYQHIPKKK